MKTNKLLQSAKNEDLSYAIEALENGVDALTFKQRERAIAAVRSTLDEQTAQKRPQNCGTGYCSCIECVMDPEQPAQDQGQSCYCPECERLSKELAALKAQPQPAQQVPVGGQVVVGRAELAMIRNALQRDADAGKQSRKEMLEMLDASTQPALAEQPAQQQKPVAWVDAVMEQAQVFASAWSLVGGRFDDGSAMETAEQEKADLRTMLTSTPASKPLTDEQFATEWHRRTGRIMGTDKMLLLQAKYVTEAAHGIKVDA